jgi:hypothetical protein
MPCYQMNGHVQVDWVLTCLFCGRVVNYVLHGEFLVGDECDLHGLRIRGRRVLEKGESLPDMQRAPCCNKYEFNRHVIESRLRLKPAVNETDPVLEWLYLGVPLRRVGPG